LITDAADRVLIPKSLMEYAKIDKEVVLFAYNEQIEIWSDKLYEEFLGSEPEEFAEYADEIFGGKDAD
jgi:MraZ protein